MSRFAAIAAIALLAACGGETAADPSDASTSCWQYDCPSDPGATTCGTCTHQGSDTECVPGFVCNCAAMCVKGPRTNDGGMCPVDAGPGPDPGLPDAQTFEWPVCEP